MLQRLYVHNFGCLDNFEFKPGNHSSALLIGKNGSGKSTLLRAFKLFQAIGRGSNRIGQLVDAADFMLGRTAEPMRLELQVKLAEHVFVYSLGLELPKGFRELRVLDEQLILDGVTVYSREHAEVTLLRNKAGIAESVFNIDWHLVALPIIQDHANADPLASFRQWLSRMVLLAPIPPLMTGTTTTECLTPDEYGRNFSDWLSGLLAHYPAAYSRLNQYLQEVLPDMAEFRFEPTGKNTKNLLVRFSSRTTQYEFDFDVLSDGEKCFFLCAVVLAANQCYGPLFTFWDEPDNYLSIHEVSHFVMALRRGFHQGGQLLLTSHHSETVRRFSDENTWVLGRKSHMEPAVIRPLHELSSTGDIIQLLLSGELEP